MRLLAPLPLPTTSRRNALRVLATLPVWWSARVRAGEPLAIIVAKRSLASDLSQGQLSRVYRGLPTTSADGTRFMPLTLPASHPLRQEFDRVVLGMSPSQSASFWIDQQLRGVTLRPKEVASVALMAHAVSVLPGAIGYLPTSQMTATVRALRVDGKQVGDADYLLQ